MKIKTNHKQFFGQVQNFPKVGKLTIDSNGVVEISDDQIALDMVSGSDDWELVDEEKIDDEDQQNDEDQLADKNQLLKESLKTMKYKDMVEIAKEAGLKGHERFKTEVSLRAFLNKNI